MLRIVLLALTIVWNISVIQCASTKILVSPISSADTELASFKKALQDKEFCKAYCAQWLPDTYPHNVDQLRDFQDNKSWGDLISGALVINRKIALKVASLVQKKRDFKEKVFEVLLRLLQLDRSTDDIIAWMNDHQEFRVSTEQINIILTYRDRNGLQHKLAEAPNNPRLLLRLGLVEQTLGNYHNAYVSYKKRISLPTFPQENYYALYYLARVTELLSESNPDQYTWEEASGYYEKAHMMRPHRAEPLVRLANHALRKKQYDKAYELVCKATELPVPSVEQEILPIELDDYEYHRWELLSRAAWYMQEFEKGEDALRKAIVARPHHSHLYSNLKRFQEKRAVPPKDESKT